MRIPVAGYDRAQAGKLGGAPDAHAARLDGGPALVTPVAPTPASPAPATLALAAAAKL